MKGVAEMNLVARSTTSKNPVKPPAVTGLEPVSIVIHSLGSGSSEI